MSTGDNISNNSPIKKQLLQDVLRENWKNSELTVINIDVRRAVGTGDNYMSLMSRVKVTFREKPSSETKTRSFIVKTRPENEMANAFIENMQLFTKEVSMYAECLPKMEEYQSYYFPDETEFLSARFYKCKTPDTIILDDLADLNYKMAKRRQQLDYDQCIEVMRAIARFHALSIKIQKYDPEVIDRVSYEFYTEENRSQMSPFMEQSFKHLSDEIEKWPNSSRFADIVRRIGLRSYDLTMDVMKQSKKCTNVLNHGDLWMNNMLFRYSQDGSIEHIKLLDFQLCRYTSPVLDLFYFLFSSPKADVLTERMYDLIDEYHRCLSNDLKQQNLNPNLITSQQLYNEIKDRIPFAIMVISSILPVVIANPEDALNMDELSDEKVQSGEYNAGEFPLLKNYRDPYYKQTAAKLFLHLEKTGLLTAAQEKVKQFEK